MHYKKDTLEISSSFPSMFKPQQQPPSPSNFFSEFDLDYGFEQPTGMRANSPFTPWLNNGKGGVSGSILQAGDHQINHQLINVSGDAKAGGSIAMPLQPTLADS